MKSNVVQSNEEPIQISKSKNEASRSKIVEENKLHNEKQNIEKVKVIKNIKNIKLNVMKKAPMSSVTSNMITEVPKYIHIKGPTNQKIKFVNIS